MIQEKACLYLNSTAKQIQPSLLCSFKLAQVTHSFSLSCVRARVVTYYTEVFSGHAAKMSVFDVLGWWLYPRDTVSHLQSQGCVRTLDFFSAHT